ARVDPIHAGGERDDLNPVEVLVGGVVAHEDRRALLAHFAPDGRLKVDPPDVTAFHRPRLPRWPRPIPALRPRALLPGPSAGTRPPGPYRGRGAARGTR